MPCNCDGCSPLFLGASPFENSPSPSGFPHTLSRFPWGMDNIEHPPADGGLLQLVLQLFVLLLPGLPALPQLLCIPARKSLTSATASASIFVGSSRCFSRVHSTKVSALQSQVHATLAIVARHGWPCPKRNRVSDACWAGFRLRNGQFSNDTLLAVSKYVSGDG
jgi:hypothetical protein